MQDLRWETYKDHQLQALKWEAETFLKGVKMTRDENGFTLHVSIFFFRGNTPLDTSFIYLYDPLNFLSGLHIHSFPSCPSQSQSIH